MSWIVLLIVVIVFAVVLAVKPMSMWKTLCRRERAIRRSPGASRTTSRLSPACDVALGCLILLCLPLPLMPLMVLGFLLESGRWELCVWVAVLTAEYLLARRIQYALATKPEQWWRSATAADVRSALRRGSDVNAMNGAALRMAACYSDAAVVELLIEKGADMTQTNLGNGRFSGTPLHRAADHGNIPAIAVLLDRGADINASSHGTPLCHAAEKGNVEAIAMLLDHGADVNIPDSSGTPLCHVARIGKVEAIAMLLDHGADINMPGLSGTPLCHAAEKGNVEAIAMLLDRGADVDRSANAIPGSPTPLWRAARRGNVEAIAMLLDHGADASIPGYYAFSASVQAFPLEIAVRENNWAAAGMLLLSREAAEDGLAPCVASLSPQGSCGARMQPALDLCPTCAAPQWFFCPSCSRRVRGQQFEEPGEWRREPDDKLVSAGDCIPCDLAGVRLGLKAPCHTTAPQCAIPNLKTARPIHQA